MIEKKSIYIGYEYMKDIYYLWEKGINFGVVYNKYYGVNNNWIRVPLWISERHSDNFYKLINILEITMASKVTWNGQSKSEYQKNYKRVKDIIAKSNGDKDKVIALSKTQSNRIKDEWKAINRAMAAREVGRSEGDVDMYQHVFEVFFQRAFELGSVSKQDYREYQLEKIGI